MTASSERILQQLAKSIKLTSSELEVEHKVVIPLLRSLGYEDSDWKRQITFDSIRLDFLIHLKQPKIFAPLYLVIEVKSSRKNISSCIWQINQYMRQSHAVLGLLTNGFSYYLLYHLGGQVATFAQFDQSLTPEDQRLFFKLLSKSTCLKIGNAFYQSHKQFHQQFITAIANSFSNKDILKLKDENLPRTNFTRRDAMIITVFNNKGGVGKTTTTINLGAALNQLGKRVLLIDIDAQANLTTGLGIDPLEHIEKQGKKDISHLLTEPKTSLEEVVVKKRWNDIHLDMVPSHIRLSFMEAELIMTPDIDRVLAKKLKKYREQYDYILIDPPPSFGKANTIALMASSGVLIPTQLAPYPARALEYVVNRAIALDQSREEPLPILGIAVSMYNRTATKVATAMSDQILEIMAKNPESKNVQLWPERTWIPGLSVISVTSGKGYPLCHAEYDQELNSKEKEAAQDAFGCYMELANHFIGVTAKIIEEVEP